MGISTHIRESPDNVEKGIVDLAGEALELVMLVDVVGLELGDLVEEEVHDIVGGTILQLDDVLAGDDLAGPGSEDGSPLVEGLGGRGSEGRREKCEEGSGEVHCGRIKPGKVTEM